MAEAIFTRCVNPPNVIPIEKGGTGGTIASEARANLDVMTGIQLYHNLSGAYGTITPSDSIENYIGAEVFFLFTATVTGNIFRNNRRVWHHGKSAVGFNLTYMDPFTESNEPRIKVLSSNITISDNSLMFGPERMGTLRPKNTVNSGGQVTVTDLSQWEATKIYKVIGYRY